jgi:acetyltransferase-like isoleucine patch superfamily enzyme
MLRPYLARTPLIWGDKNSVTIGSNVHLVDVIINCRSGRVTIEDNVFFGHGVMLLTGTHEMRARGAARHGAVPSGGRDIVIRNGAWIASNTVIIGPCDIGKDAVVAAGSVATGKLESACLYAGNPVKLIRPIEFFDDAMLTPPAPPTASSADARP